MMKKNLYLTALILIITLSFMFAGINKGLQSNFEFDTSSNLRTEYFVDFEGPGETKASYAAGIVNLSGKDWNLDNVLIGTADSDIKFGDRAARFRHQTALAATMTMLEDKEGGLGTLSFYYSRSAFANDQNPVAPIIVAEYSTNAGDDWVQIGSDINLDGINQLTLYSHTVNVEGYVRVRIRSISGSDGRRFNIDDITMTDYGDDESVAMPSFSPPGGTYYNALEVEITTTTPEATIYYTLDGTDPTEDSFEYTIPVEIDETTTVKARAYADGLNPSLIATAVYTISYPVEIIDIATLRDSPQDGTVYGLTGEVILTFQQSFRNQKFVQDNTGGILIDDPQGIIDTDYEVGDGLTNLIGTISTYGNMLQLIPIQDPGPSNTQNNPIVPVTITLSDFIDDIMTYQSRVVKIINVNFTSANGTLEFANGTVYPVSDGTDTIDFRTTFYDVDYIGEVIPIDMLTLRGIPNSRAEGHFFTSRNLADFLPPVGDINIDIQPEMVNYGDVPVNEVSTPIIFTISNSGLIDVTIVDLLLEGEDTDHFILDDLNTYPYLLEPDESITLAVSFAPLSSGMKEAHLEIEATDDIDTEFFYVDLYGNGIAFLPPQNPAAVIINWHDVELTWDLPSRSRTLIGFDVYRDGWLISPDTPLTPETTHYIDYEVPAGDYEYTIRAIYSMGCALSDIVVVAIEGPVPDVEMNPEPGEYEDYVEVTLSVPDGIDDVSIFYTLDGSEPDDESTLYDGESIVINESLTIKAIGYKLGWETGGISEGEYTILLSNDDHSLIPLVTGLKQNHPNPFNPDTEISFTLRKSDRVTITIYNVRGERIRVLIEETLSAGEHATVWNGRDQGDRQMPSGVYFYRMSTTDYQKIRKMVMIK